MRVVNWEHPANNDFLLVSEFSVTGPLDTCRPDLIGFVNDPTLCWYNALLIAANGTESPVEVGRGGFRD